MPETVPFDEIFHIDGDYPPNFWGDDEDDEGRMTTTAKRKGNAAELEVARLIAELTGWDDAAVDRLLTAVRADP